MIDVRCLCRFALNEPNQMIGAYVMNNDAIRILLEECERAESDYRELWQSELEAMAERRSN